MVFKKKQVVMLPSKEKAKLAKHNCKIHKGALTFSNYEVEDADSYEPQNIYILSDEEIKEGDFIIYPAKRGVLRDERDVLGVTRVETIYFYKGTKFLTHNNDKNKAVSAYCKKIIASTDKLLNLSEPSQSFIEKYVSEYNKGNVIEWVNVEYEEYTETTYEYGIDSSVPISKLKVRPDNTIIIHPIKDSYTREEAILKCKELVDLQLTTRAEKYKWIEENI